SVAPLRSALRADEVRESLPREELLRNAPETEAGCFRVPAILDEG
ncbi:MAG: Asp-tRNA(Asn)/Glu-tRNA(Gln) amidotransferase GatCAB subunit C, partial [Anaerolineaceae bacterium]|nr:Asp-tRNA(Asn)/Glu-tRNA(Gln) amidotransferase GatCAB subunit C [Anaerolineaceae bacterium]